MIRFYGFALLSIVFLGACKKGDKVPAYIEIPQVKVASSGATGSSTSKITDAWVYSNEILLGVWELPARIPVLADGPTEIQISPAVKRNGMFDDRVRYPFYTWWSGTLDLHPEEVMTLAPEVTYTPDVDAWIEDFEEPGFQFFVSENSDTTLNRYTSVLHPEVTLLEGSSAAGGFVLDQQHPYMRIYTAEDFNATGRPIFLEIDYSTNVMLTIGMIFVNSGTVVSTPFVYLTPTVGGSGITPGWNKAYIDLSPVFNQVVTQRNFYIEASAPAEGPARIYLDNIKVMRGL